MWLTNMFMLAIPTIEAFVQIINILLRKTIINNMKYLSVGYIYLNSNHD